jgi:hypothetical protein
LVGTEAVPTGAPVAVRVASEDADGQVATTDVEVPRIGDDGRLAVLTPTWAFDVGAVGPQCEPPSDPSESGPPSTVVFGGGEPSVVISGPPRVKPVLPPPGPGPEDAPAATADALTAFRTVYDIGDLYDEGKVALLENPALAATIFREVRDRRVVEPFVSQLAPLFDSVAFVNPTEAAVLYRVGPSYSWSIGRVLLVEGVWRVGLGTLCRDLSDAGYRCPDVVADPRPGPLG